MTDTPRTNEVEETCSNAPYSQAYPFILELARTLERELSAKSAEVERLRDLLSDMRIDKARAALTGGT